MNQAIIFADSLKNVFTWDITQNLNEFDFVVKSSIRKPYKEGFIKAEILFLMENATPSYDKGDLTLCLDGETSYDYITRTSENQGVCDKTGFISDSGKQPSGTFSLGLMQKIFYYRKKEWYAGQFVKIVSCRDDVSEEAKLYLQTILNGLTPKLSSYLVRDIQRVFYDSDLLLPLTKDNTIDYNWMELYVRKAKQLIGKRIIECINKEWMADNDNNSQ